MLLLGVLVGCAPPIRTPQLSEQARTPNLVLVLHGSGDSPASWALPLLDDMRSALTVPEDWTLVAYDWEEAASDRLAASSRGKVEGEAIGHALAEAGYQHIHVIAHSVGAFVADAMLRTLATNEDRATLHATFLDPFAADGLLDWTYGLSRFGETADFAENYLNDDDAAPSTNDPLVHAHNFYVAPIRPNALDDARWHGWPVEFWHATITAPRADQVGASLGLEQAARDTEFDADTLRARFPPGASTVLHRPTDE